MWIWIWLAITVLSAIVEFSTSSLVSIWFAGGGIVAMILSAIGLEWYISAIAFLVVSIACLFLLRKFAFKYLNKEETKTNAQSVIGKEFTLVEGISSENAGAIKINGVVWTAICEDQTKAIENGKKVKVLSLKGNKYIVEEA